MTSGTQVGPGTQVDTAAPSSGLRERKRSATRRRIVEAARAGALECGIEALTVEAIARAAEVSPRSLFNYFPTKEAAILGSHDEHRQGMTDAEFDALPDDLAAAVATVVTTALADGVEDPDDELLRAVVLRFPHLLDPSRAQWKHAVRAATETVGRLLVDRSVASGTDAAEAATVVVAMCVTAVRVGLSTTDRDGADPVAIDTVAARIRAAARVVLADDGR